MVKKAAVDSSVIVKWLNQENETNVEKADDLLESAYKGKMTLLVPELAKYEVGKALLMGKKLTSEQGVEALDLFYSLPLRFVSETNEMAKDTFQISIQAGITYCDASFVALAKQEEAVLVTDNPKHQAKIDGVKVVALADYDRAGRKVI